MKEGSGVCAGRAPGVFFVGNHVGPEPLAMPARARNEVTAIRETAKPVGDEGPEAATVDPAGVRSNRAALGHRLRS